MAARPSRRGRIAVFAAAVGLLSAGRASAQDGRDYLRVIGRPEVLAYAADVSTIMNQSARRKFPQIEEASEDGAKNAFCATLRDSPDLLIAPFAADQAPEQICGRGEVLLALPFGRQTFVLYTAPGAPRFNLTHQQLFHAMARELPRDGGTDIAEGGFEPNPNKRWRDISPDLPDVPIRLLGPPRRAVQWLTFEDLLLRSTCFEMPAIQALARVDRQAAEQHCLARRSDQAIVYADGEKYNESPAILPQGTEVAINERSSMSLMPNAVAQPVDGVLPDADALNAGRYPLSRTLFAVVKVARLDIIPNLRTFVSELMAPAASGPKGRLFSRGLDVLPEDELRRGALRAQFASAAAGASQSEAQAAAPAKSDK